MEISILIIFLIVAINIEVTWLIFNESKKITSSKKSNTLYEVDNPMIWKVKLREKAKGLKIFYKGSNKDVYCKAIDDMMKFVDKYHD